MSAQSSESLGFCRRGEPLAPGAVHATIPQQLKDGEPSICGLKAFLLDERRRFYDNDGPIDIDCAKVAALDIIDSPVHIHDHTLETYHILAGHGRMLLGDTVQVVGPGSLIVIPPQTRHGLMSDDSQQALRVVMTFTPGLAPLQHEQWRDETVLAPAASQVIASLTHSQ